MGYPPSFPWNFGEVLMFVAIQLRFIDKHGKEINNCKIR